MTAARKGTVQPGPGPTNLVADIDTKKQRPRTEGMAQHVLNKPILSLTVLKPQIMTPVPLCGATRSRKTANACLGRSLQGHPQAWVWQELLLAT